jgi:SAM-dependent methyltransferase
MAIEKRKEYGSYDEYKEHQMEKTNRKGLRSKLKRRFNGKVKIFEKRFNLLRGRGHLEEGKKAICLGSRMGEEVVALNNLKMDSIGVDLVPYLPNVIEADFNDLPFEDGTFDLAYSNSFDHSFDADMFFKSVERVLKVGGLFVLDIFPGEEMQSSYEVTYIKNADDVKKSVCESGHFEFVDSFDPLPKLYRVNHSNPQLIFRRVEKK